MEPAAAADASEPIALELINALEAEGHFRLSNPTSEAISFSSTRQTSGGHHAQHVHLKCKAESSSQWDEGPRPMGDSPATIVEVPPGSHENVVILWEPGVLQDDAACRIDLRLADGTVVESGEFLQ